MKLLPKPEEFETLKMMHSLRQQGLTLRAIVALLNQRGVSTKTGRAGWQPKVVMRILDRTANLICEDQSLTCEQVDSLLHDVTGAMYQTEKAVCDTWHEG